MSKYEQVIKGLEACLREDIGDYKCEKCPYLQDTNCIKNVKRDALALLKEQEARIRELEEALRALKYSDQDTLKGAMMSAT